MATSPQTPQNFSRRAGSGMPGRVRRSIDGNVESRQRYGNSIEVSKEGRVETKVARNGGLRVTKDGLMLDTQIAGEKNRPPLARIQTPDVGATAAELRETVAQLLAELRKTGNMRG